MLGLRLDEPLPLAGLEHALDAVELGARSSRAAGSLALTSAARSR